MEKHYCLSKYNQYGGFTLCPIYFIYCPKGCYTVHVTPQIPIPESIPAENNAGFPSPTRILWADIMRDGGSYTLVYASEREKLFKVLIKAITSEKTLIRIGYKPPEVIELEPQTLAELKHQEIDWVIAAQLGKALLGVMRGQSEPIKAGGRQRALEMVKFLFREGKI